MTGVSIADKAQQNREYVRRLLKKKRPEFAAVLEQVVWELTRTCDAPSAESPGPEAAGCEQRRPSQTGRRVGVVVTDKGRRRCQWVLGAMAGDLCGELGAGGDVELGEHVGQVRLYGPARDVQAVADLGVG